MILRLLTGRIVSRQIYSRDTNISFIHAYLAHPWTSAHYYYAFHELREPRFNNTTVRSDVARTILIPQLSSGKRPFPPSQLIKLAPQNSRGFPTVLGRVVRRQAGRPSTRSWSSLRPGASSAWNKKMASGSTADKKAEKSTWASAVDSINPWSGARSSTPAPKEPAAPPPPKPSNTGDHSTNPIYGLSARKYPPDCPPLKVKWFHAIDVGLPPP